RALDPDNRFKRSKGDTHVARVSSDAVVALAQNSVNTIKAVYGAATAAWISFVAMRKRWVIKIVATRALQKIAANCRHVAQLRTGSGKQSLAQNRITRFNQRMLGDVGIA